LKVVQINRPYKQASNRQTKDVAGVAPVTSETVERSNSSLRFVKSGFRSTRREDRLNALFLLFIHKDIALDCDASIDDYAKRNQRRMAFINPLQ